MKKNIIIILLALIIIIMGLYIFKLIRSDYIRIYYFNGESANFKYEKGLFVKSNNGKYIELSNFKLKNNLNIKSLTINIAFNESIWKVADYDVNSDGDFNNWFNSQKFLEYDKQIITFDKKDDKSSFSEYDTNFPYDFKVEVNYCTDKICTVEIMNNKSEEVNRKVK